MSRTLVLHKITAAGRTFPVNEELKIVAKEIEILMMMYTPKKKMKKTLLEKKS